MQLAGKERFKVGEHQDTAGYSRSDCSRAKWSIGAEAKARHDGNAPLQAQKRQAPNRKPASGYVRRIAALASPSALAAVLRDTRRGLSQLLTACAVYTMGCFAVRPQLARRADFGSSHAEASVTNRAIGAGAAVAVGEARTAALRIDTLATRSAICAELALGDATLIGTTYTDYTHIVLVRRLTLRVLDAGWVAGAVDALLTRTTLSSGHAGRPVHRLGYAAVGDTSAPSAAGGRVGTGFLAGPVYALSTVATLAIEDTVVGVNRSRLALRIHTLVTNTAVQLYSAALGDNGARGLVWLTGVSGDVTGVATSAVANPITEASFGAGAVRGTEAARCALVGSLAASAGWSPC